MDCTGKQNPQSCFPRHNTLHKLKSNDTLSAVSKPYTYKVIAQYPHDTSAFTQGLVFYKKNLYESTGLLGESSVRKLNLIDGKVLIKNHPPEIYFGEGLTILNHQLIQMSLKTGKVFFFEPETLNLVKRTTFENEVWGTTTIANQIVISNGSSNLLFVNPANFSITKKLNITLDNEEISGLNELEYAEGYVYANVWPGSCIVEIDPVNGKVTGWLNLSGLFPADYQLPESAVLNGIAYHQQKKSFFVTGKFWPFIYLIKLITNEN